jgi:hypothetical protein
MPKNKRSGCNAFDAGWIYFLNVIVFFGWLLSELVFSSLFASFFLAACAKARIALHARQISDRTATERNLEDCQKILCLSQRVCLVRKYVKHAMI